MALITISVHPRSISICCTEHTYNQIEIHTCTVRHSKINTVRAAMIPLYYLHAGPPSCTCLPHSPFQCFSTEVVITKACSMFLQLPLTSPVFLFFAVQFHRTWESFANLWHSRRYVKDDSSAIAALSITINVLCYKVPQCPASKDGVETQI